MIHIMKLKDFMEANTKDTNLTNKTYYMMKIAVAGTGYVGMSIATLLAQHNHVTAVDVIPEKVEKINKKISPIQDDVQEKVYTRDIFKRD